MRKYEKKVKLSYSTGNIIINHTEKTYTNCNINELNKKGIGIYIRNDILDLIPDYLYPIVQYGKIGFINSYADIVIPPVYDNFIGRFSSIESLITVFKDNVCGILNTEGKELFMGKYKNILVINNNFAIITNNENQKGIIEVLSKKVTVPFNQYDNIEYINNILIASKGNLKGLITPTGLLKTPIKYKWISNIECGLLRVIIENREENKIKSKWGIIDVNGNEVLPVTYDRISQILDKSIIEASLGGKYLKIDIINGNHKF